MKFEFELPNIGEGVEEADIAEILVSVGDSVEEEQTVMELETEKAVVELPCPRAGKIEEILVSTGDTVRVGAKIMILSTGNGESEDDPEEKDEDAKQSKSESKSAEKKEAKKDDADSADQEAEASDDSGDEAELVDGVIEFELPPLGEGVESADVAEILVSEGDTIEADQSVMELETEKAVVELPCPHPGKIKKIHVSEGDSISVGATVLTIETSSKVGGKKAPAKDKPAEKKEAAKKGEGKKETEERPASKEKESPKAAKAAPPARQESAAEDNGTPVPAAPSTRRLARQLGVNLREVKGSGAGGRITQDDVQAFVRDRLQRASVPARASSGELVAGSLAPPPLPDFTKFGAVEREKMNKIARTAAENLTLSWNVIPHVTQHERVDITDLEAARKRFGQGVGKNGPKVTMTAIVMKALTKCLQAFPKFNSSLDPETNEIVYKRYYHIGCAVDTPNGLLVPVVKDCDSKSILDIAFDITQLAEKARDRKLPVDSMQGATCTVTNLGGIGGVAFTPIVNYPEVCILGMCRGQQELRLIDGKVEERLILPLSLSYDHRVINGADAARFMVTLANMLADPFQLLTTV